MTALPLRCHLLIGPPGSGKTTLAQTLAPLLQGPNREAALVLSTDAIREELYGDAAVQGPWDEIRALLLERLQVAVAAGRPVIIDATHARRPWRLLYTQQLQLSQPVEWIGWWLKTPLDTCKAWSKRRDRPVPEAVVEDFHGSLNHRFFGPDRSEGFAAIVALNPAAGEDNAEDLSRQLAGLDGRIRNAVNRDRAKEPFLHRYARLLDLERLLFLLRLLTSFNGLDASDPATAAALAAICNPPPEGDLAERAAAYLAGWSAVQGGNSECYADGEAIGADLAWLEANGFVSLAWDGAAPIELGEQGPPLSSSVHGGFPALADRRVFRRLFTLLRHIVKEPFDAPEPGGRHESSASGPLYGHLIEQLSAIEGSYGSDQEAVLRYDIEHVLRPYGFLPPVKGRPRSLRHGYAIGTALLSADQLLEVHALLRASLERLSDQSQQPLLEGLEDRLERAGLLQLGEQQQRRDPKRALANRAFTEAVSGTLAAADQSQRVERAIRDRRRIWLLHTPDLQEGGPRRRGYDGRFRVWPLQLLFHNISWYLAFETDDIGREHGLIRTLRLDRLELLGDDGNTRRGSEAEHGFAMERLERLLAVCGGLYFGNDIDQQLAVMDRSASSAAASGCYQALIFSCTPEVFALIREEARRFLPEHTAYSRPIPGLSSWEAGPLDTLEPNAPTDSHPYRVRILLPRWTVQDDWDLRNWLFRWGARIRIEEPTNLRELQLQQAREVVALYGSSPL